MISSQDAQVREAATAGTLSDLRDKMDAVENRAVNAEHDAAAEAAMNCLAEDGQGCAVRSLRRDVRDVIGRLRRIDDALARLIEQD